jgi:hypothetical protein
MEYPNLLTIENAVNGASYTLVELPDGRWVPARAKGCPSFKSRCYCAWLVFTGKADALIYEGQ